ncbi:hypothetical protein A3A68_02135 [Candidatus Saccharibacteria bacterium RIFCSPLOWO2_01_FULL_48_13]|nr:MAG: hypothetical protein A3A68_02135 [Candidatus Saccharibacteria bacterium RIFCSPLOWO2_01_FULL_48_13]
MKKEPILFGIIGLMAGIIIAGFAAGYAVNNNQRGMMGMMGMNSDVMDRINPSGHEQMSMAEMSSQLKNKSGDDFDKAFVEMMIAHHQGAIDMAVLASSQAKHEEVKKLAEAVISAQTEEIDQMLEWQKSWGYGSDEVMQMMH